MIKPFVSLAVGLPMVLTAQHCTYLFAPLQDWFFWGSVTGCLLLKFINKVYEQ